MSASNTKKTRVAIVGATGYTALDLLKILARHPYVEVTTVTSRQEDEPLLAEVHPSLTGVFDLRCENIAPGAAAEKVDVSDLEDDDDSGDDDEEPNLQQLMKAKKAAKKTTPPKQVQSVTKTESPPKNPEK